MTPRKIALALVCVVVVALVAAVASVQLTWRIDYSSVPLPALAASADPAVIARGEYVALHVAHCGHCHSPSAPVIGDLSGGPIIDAGPFGRFAPPNLTSDDDTGLGKRSDGEIARAIRNGVTHDGALAAMMRIGVGPMADEDVVAVLSYLRTLPPVRRASPGDAWGFVAKALSRRFTPRVEPPPAYVAPGGVSVARGAYLANGPALCATCHTARDPMQAMRPVGPPFAGDPHPHKDKTDPAFEIRAPNITPGGVLAAFDEDAFVARFHAGRALAGSIMPWESFQGLSDDDVRSIHRYLRTLPAAADTIGAVRRAR